MPFISMGKWWFSVFVQLLRKISLKQAKKSFFNEKKTWLRCWIVQLLRKISLKQVYECFENRRFEAGRWASVRNNGLAEGYQMSYLRTAQVELLKKNIRMLFIMNGEKCFWKISFSSGRDHLKQRNREQNRDFIQKTRHSSRSLKNGRICKTLCHNGF